MKLTTKISFILVMVVAISGLLIGAMTIDAISDSFAGYLKDMRASDIRDWEHIYLNYYVSHDHSWVNVETLMSQGPGDSFYDSTRQNARWRPIVLLSEQGRILAHPIERFVGLQLKSDLMRHAIALQYEDQTIAFMLPIDFLDQNFWLLEDNFMRNVSLSIIKGILVTCLVAALIGLAVSKNMMRPLVLLGENIRRMGREERVETVPVYSDDEIGELSMAFNLMALELKKNNEARVNLFADVSHELRTPLTTIAVKLENKLMRNRPLEPEEISSLYDEVLRLKNMVNELQNISKIDAGHMDITKTLIDFKTFFDEFFLLLDADAQARAIGVEVDMADHLPYCYADPERLKQIVLNLVSNALRYTSDGGSVRIHVRSDDRYFIFSVEDNGIGMAPEEVDHVFDRFYRTDQSRARETGGFGLGMAITKGLVDAHGGFIDVRSTLGEGTVFTVRLPLYEQTV